MNQWTSPDAYSGDVHDPMSQHPYMWNANNPVQYGDPSGYETGEVSVTCAINMCNDMSPPASNVFVKGEISAVGLGASVTVTGDKKVFVSGPRGFGVAAGTSTRAAVATIAKGVGSGLAKTAGSTASGAITAGIAFPNAGKTAADVIGGPSTSTSVTIPVAGVFGITIDYSVNNNGSTLSIGIGAGPGASVTQGTATQVNQGSPR